MRRPWLHALELRFNHPVSGEPLVLNAPYPPDLQASLGLLSEAVLP
jgi:23S rRNA pseudouridine1911/1915/1917 synthase